MKPKSVKLLLGVCLLAVAAVALYRFVLARPAPIPPEAQRIIQAGRNDGQTQADNERDLARDGAGGQDLDVERPPAEQEPTALSGATSDAPTLKARKKQPRKRRRRAPKEEVDGEEKEDRETRKPPAKSAD